MSLVTVFKEKSIKAFLSTLLRNGESGVPLFAKFLLAFRNGADLLVYLALRSRESPRFDLDLLAYWTIVSPGTH